MAKKIYAVRRGKQTGLFDTWAECQKQVAGYSGAEYKSFTRMEDARAFLQGEGGQEPGQDYRAYLQESGTAVAYVDGSYENTSGDFSCGVVFLYEGQEEHFSERYSDRELAAMRNVAGELKGSETAMRYALERGVKKLVIYHDYEGIAKWCNGAWKANKEGTKFYQSYYEEVKNQIQIIFVKVKGHSGDQYNDLADKLAKKALGL